MSTLLTIRTPGGTMRRCDAKCYNATKPHCDCICKGGNHGVGRRQGIQNAIRALEEYCKREGLNVPMVSKEEKADPSGGVEVYPLFGKR